jgi:integrase
MKSGFIDKFKTILWGKPEKSVPLTKPKRKRQKRLKLRSELTLEQIQQMILFTDEFYKDKYYSDRMKLVLLLLSTTGCRVCELLEIKMETFMEQLNSSKPSIYLHVPKTVEVRTINLQDEERDKILDLVERLNFKEGYLISKKNWHMKKLHPIHWITAVNLFLKNFSVKYNLTHLNLRSHSFRITMVTTMARDHGLDTAKLFIGHKRLSTTERYSRWTKLTREEEFKYRTPLKLEIKK